MATSRNYDELYWAWDEWRDAVGAPAREDYERYVELKNIGAAANGEKLYNPSPLRLIIVSYKNKF